MVLRALISLIPEVSEVFSGFGIVAFLSDQRVHTV
jgi:hypothetical protein